MINNIRKDRINPFVPFKVENVVLQNRFMRSATYDGSADATGAVTENSLELYRRLGKAGIGLIVTGHAYIAEVGQAGPGQYGIYSDKLISGWQRLVEAVHAGGGKAAVQIAHAGINSSYLQGKGQAALAVSATGEATQPHREMRSEDIEETIEAFAAAARRAVEAGFDAVQLHAAHGYLMSQFLSPITNRRNDAWGGSVENRRRFHIEVVKRIRSTIGGKIPLLMKFGVMDDIEGGLTLSDGIETAKLMVQNGLSGIEVSGGIGMTSVAKGTAYFRERAAALKHAVTVPVAVVGGIRSLETVRSILDSGDADMISMSRSLIREPELLLRWQKENQENAKCVSCSRCMVFARKGTALRCAQDNPTD
jgi:2,4-dienoyl-CoA reductase-like NADH-dependent reductase (Old Yellow Enzyme family)